jgi:chromosome segregation ATPase
MKLPAILSGGKPAADALAECERQITAASEQVAMREAERNAALAADEYDGGAVERINFELANAQHAVANLTMRRDVLRQRAAVEAEQQRRDKRQADWEALNPLLMKRAALACKIGNQLREAADMVRQLNDQTANITERFLPVSDVRITESYLQPPGPLLRQVAAVDADMVNDWISQVMTGHDELKADYHFEAPAKEEAA